MTIHMTKSSLIEATFYSIKLKRSDLPTVKVEDYHNHRDGLD